MLMMANYSTIFNVIAIILCVVILIRVILLGGRLVRAVEKIADKVEKCFLGNEPK
jgi:hypothetical protein